MVRDADFERLQKALREYVEAQDGLGDNNLQDVLSRTYVERESANLKA